MLDTLKELLAHQYDASLSMLKLAIDRCPDGSWNECVANWKFCQTAFHVVFFADVYLQPSDEVDVLKRQPFHLEHEADFRDYEELKDRPPVLLYEKAFVLSYLQNVPQGPGDNREGIGRSPRWSVGISPAQVFPRRTSRL